MMVVRERSNRRTCNYVKDSRSLRPNLPESSSVKVLVKYGKALIVSYVGWIVVI
jgi:hypothetical protein